MELHELACSSLSLHAVPWTFMKVNELACSFISLCAVPFFVWADHKNFAVLVGWLSIWNVYGDLSPVGILLSDMMVAKKNIPETLLM